jgi:Na+/H+ antiporter NhaC
LHRQAAWSRALGALAAILIAWVGLSALRPAGAQHEEETFPGEETARLTDLRLEAPAFAVAGVPFSVRVISVRGAAGGAIHFEGRVLRGDELVGSVVQAASENGGPVTLEELVAPDAGLAVVEVRAGAVRHQAEVRVLSGTLTILPPLLAIALAIVFRQVLLALLAGVWLGAFLVTGLRPLAAALRVVDRYILQALTDTGHASIIIFSMLLGGMVAIVSRSGGTYGIVTAVRRWAATRRSTQAVTWLMGMFIFFDDYANTLVVGNTMRPVTDRLRISREKLAYLVDCTAAPIASVALISTWVGVEVGLIGDALTAVGSDLDPYQVFLASIPYRFYPLLALVFALAVAVSGRDLGPMLAAERRAAAGKLLDDGATPIADTESERMQPLAGAPHRWYNAVLPIVTVIGVTLVGLWVTGRSALAADGSPLGMRSWSEIVTGGHLLQDLGSVFSAADSYVTLMWGSALGCLVAGVLAVGQRILTVAETIAAWLAGLKSMLLAVLILLMAWSIGAVCEDLRTATYVVGLISDAVPWALLPALVFLISGGVAFATGTSWGTMAILMPLTVPLATEIARLNGLEAGAAHTLLLGAISSVLAGATWGDHCSPISDTTILSSMASGSDHIDHVRTQMPYAVLVGVVGIVVGDLPTAWGMPPWISLLVGSGILVGALWYFGRTTEPGAAAGSPETSAGDSAI